MTLPRLLGIGDVVGEQLPGVAEAVSDAIDPNRKFNQAMRMLFIQKPELMQKFVDIEKANPGTLKAFGFNERGTDLLSGMQESFGSFRERTTRPEAEAALNDPNNRRAVATQEATGQTEGQLAQDRLTAWLANGGVDVLKKDPQAGIEAIRARLNIQSPNERTMEARTGEALAAVDTDVQLGERKIKPVDFGLPEWQEALRSGALSNEQLSGALIDPRTKGMAAMALQQFNTARDLSLRSYYGVQDDLQRERLRRALMLYDSSGQVGSADAWYELTNPGQHIPGSNHRVTPQELELVKKASETERMRSQLNTLRSIDATRKTAVADVSSSTSPEQRDAALARLNQTLTATDPNIEAYWEDRPWYRGDRLSYRDRVTKQPVAPPAELPTEAPAASTTAQLGPRESRVLDRWRALRTQKPQGYQQTIATELAREKAANPQIGAQLEASLGTETQ